MRYVKTTADHIPANIRWDVPRRYQGQTVEIAFGDFGASEAGRGSPYVRTTDRSDGSVTYERLAGEPRIALVRLVDGRIASRPQYGYQTVAGGPLTRFADIDQAWLPAHTPAGMTMVRLDDQGDDPADYIGSDQYAMIG